MVVLVLGLIGVVIFKARIVSSGELSREWGMPDDDEARAEIERIFPGATWPLDEEDANRSGADGR